jgi:TonB family protein
MFQDETQPENHLERSTALPPQIASLDANDAKIQRKRMLIALGILLAALVAVVLKDWDFWFPPSAEVQEAAVRARKTSVPVAVNIPANPTRDRKPTKAAPPVTTDPPFTATTERAALPPLQVEVVAGNRHMSVPAKTSAIHVDVDSGATSSAANTSPSASAPSSGTADRMQLSPQTTQSVTVSVPPDYPLLARQMKVQGAVSLQALISRDGSIQELQILSGPGILAAAAREAVKQWHFKPYLQNGQPVETQARITVNFTISTN